jgi:peptide deformylase
MKTLKTNEEFLDIFKTPKRKIVIYPADILRTRCRDLTESPKELIEDMWKVLARGGVGLAAPQVGEDLNLFLMSYSFKKKVIINPRILKYGDKKTSYREGCLSIPGRTVKVWRPDSIEVEYRDENFELKTATVSGFMARIFQHEFDHLQGKLIIDYEGRARNQT